MTRNYTSTPPSAALPFLPYCLLRSMHDSRAAIPLSHLSAGRVTNFYDLMDASYCSSELRE